MTAGWNHNTHYHPQLLAAVPVGARRALDVGCGLGGFARRLATVATTVDAIDRDAATLATARERSAGIANLRFAEADFVAWPDVDYDLITMIATLHHLPLRAALCTARDGLARGGVLAVLGLFATRTLAEWATSAVAFPVSYGYRLTRRLADVGAPVHEPTTTLDEIRRTAAEIVPGARITRHLLWRYTLIWTKP